MDGDNMTVRAKFKVESVTQFHQCGEVVLAPVSSGSEENKKFWQYTPGGLIKLNTINTEALSRFTPGKEFYIDFIPADV